MNRRRCGSILFAAIFFCTFTVLGHEAHPQSAVVMHLKNQLETKIRHFIAHAPCDATWLPNALTLGNVMCGFLSLIASSKNNLQAASYLIMLGSIFDLLDGAVARKLNATSALGVELDSLADGLSFCAAPAFMLYQVGKNKEPGLSLLAALAYVCAGMYRLAKFNVTHTEQKNFFIGMPTPVAALLVTAATAFSTDKCHWFSQIISKPKTLAAIGMALAYCMNSHMRFISSKALNKHLLALTVITLGAALAYGECTQKPYMAVLGAAFVFGHIANHLLVPCGTRSPLKKVLENLV